MLMRPFTLLSVLLGLTVCWQTSAAGQVGVEVVFSDQEIAAIHAYYREHGARSKPRGRSARRMPPGIAKNLARGKPLPPGIAKQALPADLRDHLPAPPAGHERIIVAGKILLVEIATQVIRDVIVDVLLSD